MSSETIRIGIALVEHQGRFLVGVRGEDSPLPGMAEFPGGKCFSEESPADGAVRECLEETGLGVRPLRLLEERTHEYPHGVVELYFWLCKPADPENVAENHQGFRWIKRDDLKSRNFPPANHRVVELLQSGG